MNKIDKMVRKDAERWAAAEMFFGEGAGTRRKLLNAEISDKAHSIDGYGEKFDTIYAGLDMTKFAEMAVRERKAIDRAAKASQNFRALKNGNYQHLTTGVFVAVGAYYLAKQTGYDKKIEAEARKAKAWITMKYKIHQAQKETP